ncbi:hypothetical protein [Francisella sp. SYW-2]|uniref:hypothetical protein n=1 Tax=Francisella sp. SYW-2 TaxID=2610886 RepID=UPI00123DF51A|nr:hypothetical protein [Francisella sp. SYW-2]
MNNNVKQILTSLGLIAVAVISFIIFAPLFVFLIIFFMIFSFFIRRKIIKENPDFFKQYTNRKGRVIDQEEDDTDINSNYKIK